MDYQKIIVLVFTFFPTLYEAFSDRYGESKKDKRSDTILLVVASVILTAVAYLTLKSWISVPLFILVWRFAAFDYTVNWFLKKYSESHRHINVFSYSGKTAYFDKLTSKVNWVLRLAVRVVILALAVWYYTIQ